MTLASIRVLLGNEPRVYRDAQRFLLSEMRPHVEVVVVEPDDVDRETDRLKPHVVVCSRLSAIVQSRPLAWVLLYPNGTNLAVINIAGEQRIVPTVAFDDLLAVVDDTTRRAQAATGGAPC